ncbi:MAG: hypothetical protein FJX77_03235 [Armatimonadetes bacterium]|nr:hypothetical protein [Armatimonadota bacterium]
MSADSAPRRPRVAALFTECRHRSHAHVILENFLEPYLFNGEWTDPGVEVVCFWQDQTPERDLAAAVAKKYGIRQCATVREALCLGGEKLAVDAVLSIAEHGEYPTNARGQKEYPRKRFFDEIVKVFRETGQVAPVFTDKHLSYRWDWAKEMYDTARELRIPFMAGSSVPLAERQPPVELPRGADIEEAVAIHGGPFEVYDFHALEVLQSFMEFRKGGETGVARVQLLAGDALWRAAEAGLWSESLAEAARAADLGPDRPPIRKAVDAAGQGGSVPAPWGILVQYRDGRRGASLRFQRTDIRWSFACRIRGAAEPLATRFYVGPWDNRNLFKALSHAIQDHFRERRAPYPIERTLLTTGILEAAVTSRHEGGSWVETPHLALPYRSRDFRKLREQGKSWKILTEALPEPFGFDFPVLSPPAPRKR